MQKVHRDDVGTDFQVRIQEDGVNVDTGPATLLEIIFTDPGGAKSTVTATNVTNGSDGLIRYKSLTVAEIRMLKIWSYIGRTTFSAGEVFSSVTPIEFEVVK